MKQKIKNTVTVAVSAYNEEKNIEAFLVSVLAQEEDDYILKNIWIFSDGSTDNTVKIARQFRDKKIKIFIYKNRKGKTASLNELYRKVKTDFLVQSDADVIFKDRNIIKEMINPLIKNPRVGMTGGNPLPTKAKTFTEKAVNCTVEAFVPLRKSFNGGNNILSVDGRILAYKKDLIKKIYIPEYDVTSNDAYTYFACLSLNYKYSFVEKAIVYFRSPQNIQDQIKQNTRFLAMPIKMSKYFDSELVKTERTIPKSLLLKQLIKVFIRHPILCLYIFCINMYCRLIVKRTEKTLTSKWSIANTTKKINYI